MAEARLPGEKLDVQVHKDSSLASTAVAEEIIRLVKATAAEGDSSLQLDNSSLVGTPQGSSQLPRPAFVKPN